MKIQLALIKSTIDNYPYPEHTRPLTQRFSVSRGKATEALVFSCLYSRWLSITPPDSPYFITTAQALETLYIDTFLSTCDFTRLGEPYALYEAFLSIDKRRLDGVWYTPKPVVDFIIHNTLRLVTKHFTNDPLQYIDFSLGSGIFANTLYSRTQNPNIMGFEINLTSVMISLMIAQSLSPSPITPLDYRHQDYLEFAQHSRLPQGTTPIIIGNPPYGHHSDFKYPPITDYYIDSIDQNGFPQVTVGKNKGIYHNYKDLYVCFIKASQDLITRANRGILACITNDSFTINNSFVGMRFNLLNHFTSMYIINLNGGVRQGSASIKGDKSIFDIKTSTCILICVRTHNPGALTNTPPCEVYYDSITGSKEHKLTYLTEGIDNIIDI